MDTHTGASAETTFRSAKDALAAGWTIYDRLHDGYLIKQRFATGWKIGRIIIPPAKGEGA